MTSKTKNNETVGAEKRLEKIVNKTALLVVALESFHWFYF